MKMKHIATVIAVTAGLFIAMPRLHADEKDTHKINLEKGKNTEKNIRQAEPPKQSTGTAKSSQQISREQNAKEQQRQKAVSQKYSPDKIKVPPPAVSKSTSTATDKSKTDKK